MSLRRGLDGRFLREGGHLAAEEGDPADRVVGLLPDFRSPALSLEPSEGGSSLPLSRLEDPALRREAVPLRIGLNRSAPTKAVAPQEVEMKPMTPATPAAPAAPAAPAIVGGWTCSACTMVNEAAATKCSFCDTPRSNLTVVKVGEAVAGEA